MALFLLLFSLGGCGEEKGFEKIPKDVLKEAEFIDILVDLYLLEGMAKYRKTNFKEHPDDFLPAHSFKVLEEHGVDRKAFDRSFEYYADHPERMKHIHEQVLNELTRKKDRVQTKIEKKK